MVVLKSHWSAIHDAYLTSHIKIARFKRDKDMLKREKENASQGYKQHKYVWSIHFPRSSWIVLRNSYYMAAINALKRKKGPLYEQYHEVYSTGSHQIPFYCVFKEGKKIGNFFLRKDIHEEDFLFMPLFGALNKSNWTKVPVSMGRDGKKNYRNNVSNDYYIFDLHKNGNIKPDSRLWYKKRS